MFIVPTGEPIREREESDEIINQNEEDGRESLGGRWLVARFPPLLSNKSLILLPLLIFPSSLPLCGSLLGSGVQ